MNFKSLSTTLGRGEKEKEKNFIWTYQQRINRVHITKTFVSFTFMDYCNAADEMKLPSKNPLGFVVTQNLNKES